MKALELPIVEKRPSPKGDTFDFVFCPRDDKDVKVTKECTKCAHLCIILEHKVKCKYNEDERKFITTIEI